MVAIFQQDQYKYSIIQLMSLGIQQSTSQKCLNSANCNYSATECEFIGLIQDLCTQFHYVICRPITIRSDCANLQWLILQLPLLHHQVCQLQFMMEFDLAIIYVPGKANIIANALLHYSNVDPARAIAVSISIELDFIIVIGLKQEQDFYDTFRDLKYCALANDRCMCIHDELVCCTLRTGGQTIVLPDNKALE